MEGEEIEAEAKCGGGQEKMKQPKNKMPSIAMQIPFSFEYWPAYENLLHLLAIKKEQFKVISLSTQLVF